MRIIGGQLAGRRFGAPAGRGTRPTSDRVREALASALESRGAFKGAQVLDLFAGSGALAFEALSRGAARAVVADSDPRAIRQIQQSAKTLHLEDKVRALRLNLLSGPEQVVHRLTAREPEFNLVFADAPYAKIHAVPDLLAALMTSRRLAGDAWVAVERPAGFGWTWPKGLASEADYRYGQTHISLGIFKAEKGRQ